MAKDKEVILREGNSAMLDRHLNPKPLHTWETIDMISLPLVNHQQLGWITPNLAFYIDSSWW